METVIYGIPNCDTMKKARAWLTAAGIGHRFHDYRTSGVDADRLAEWAARVGWQTLLNRSGTTFRKLPDQDKAGLDETRALRLMLAHPALIKRPVLEHRGELTVGFSADRYASLPR
jgi:arsenate reductase